MKSFYRFGGRPCGILDSSSIRALVFAVLVVAGCLVASPAARAQVVEAGNKGGTSVSAGAAASGYYVQYGERKLLGISAFVDADTRRRIGIEAEGRWLDFHQTANVHLATYSIGPRYHFNLGNFQPYLKGMAGTGHFNFPYNYAYGNYFVVTAGGGLDYRLKSRIYVRAADFEYQYWPQFTYGAMSTLGVSAGIRVRIF